MDRIDVAAVLMPAESPAGLAALDEELLVKQDRFRAYRRAADVGHQVAEEKLPQLRHLLPVVLGDVAVGARPRTLDDLQRGIAKQLQMLGENRALENEISLVAIFGFLLFGDL